MTRPNSMPEGAVLRRIWFMVTERGFNARFTAPRGAGLGIRRDNPKYYEVIGRWVCNEVDALATYDPEYQLHTPAPGTREED